MTIKKIVILPPLAFARFGSHPEPVASYTLEPPPDRMSPLGHRRIKPEPTLIVSDNGEILREDPEPDISFKEKSQKDGDVVHQVRPVAPFFELWGELDDGTLCPSQREGCSPARRWSGASRSLIAKCFGARGHPTMSSLPQPRGSQITTFMSLQGTSDNLIVGASRRVRLRSLYQAQQEVSSYSPAVHARRGPDLRD